MSEDLSKLAHLQTRPVQPWQCGVVSVTVSSPYSRRNAGLQLAAHTTNMAARRFVLDGDVPAGKAERVCISYLLDNHDRLLLGLQPTEERIAAAAQLAADVYSSSRSTSWCAASV
jgi:hypothetical protein